MSAVKKEQKFVKIHHPPQIFEKGNEVYIATHPLSYAGYGIAKKSMTRYEGPYTIQAILDEILIC